MKHLVVLLCCLAFAACGGKNDSTTDGGNDNGDGNNGDGNNTGDGGLDAFTPPNCMPGTTQCTDCVDNDGDGFVDEYDINCSGPLDNDEATFSTGIPGDNIDAVNQDCFFDGNSGAGNDGCNIHVCCLLGAMTVQDCPLGQNQYDPAECPPPIGNQPLSQQCIDTCGALTPPGCDCFGCCTLCDPNNPTQCYDIITNPNVSPNCTPDTLADPTKCTPCTQVPSCGDPDCGGSTCILCPGQDPSDLPPECGGQTQCPEGQTTCTVDTDCGMNQYCAAGGCCVGILL